MCRPVGLGRVLDMSLTTLRTWTFPRWGVAGCETFLGGQYGEGGGVYPATGADCVVLIFEGP